MTPYLIFVLILTIAYIIYYGYNISKDIYGKKNQEDSTEETFAVDIPDEPITPTEVTETMEGFLLGDSIVEPGIPPSDETQPKSDETSEEQKKIEVLKENLFEADVESTGGIDADELLIQMLMENPSSDLVRTKRVSKKPINV